MALKEIRLTPQLNNKVELDRTNRNIELTQTSGGIPYVELSNITIADWYKNNHVKLLSGIYTGGRPTRIKVRDHYPHSIGSDWCRLSNLLTSETNTTRVNVAKTQEFIPVVGENNYTCYKDTAFWGAINTLITVGDIEVASSMRYDIIEPYAPEEGAANYYGDRMAAVGVPMPTTPSPWYYANIDYTEQTWEVEITLNPFTMFYDTLYQQKYIWWNPYHITNYPEGLNYDPRLHAIEVDITSSYEGETIHGKRIYYIWHLPHCFAAEKAPQVAINDGTYSGPFDHHLCMGGNGCQYDTGYTASGGDCTIEYWKNDIIYQNMLLQLYPSIPKDPANELLNTPIASCLDENGNFYIFDKKGTSGYIKKYDSAGEYITVFTMATNGSAADVIYYNGYLYVGDNYSIKKVNPETGTVESTWGSYSSTPSDGKFQSSPQLAIYNNQIYACNPLRIQVFDMEGNYITKSIVPSGYYFRDIDIDPDGNIYVRVNKQSNFTTNWIYVYDTDFNLLTSYTCLYASSSVYYGIAYQNDYLYISNSTKFQKVTPGDGTVIGEKTITNYMLLYVDSNDRIFINGTARLTILDSSFNTVMTVGTTTATKYVERNGNPIGILSLSQIEKAYAVVTPSSFDPTNPSTYAKMTEYTGADFTGITLTADGLLRFKNLYPGETTHYIYLLFKSDPVGEIDTYYCAFDYETGLYSPYNGNQRDYVWFTKSPSCSEICAGSAVEGNNTAIAYPESRSTDETVNVNLDNFDNGTNLDTATIKYYIGGCNGCFLYGKGNDGGRTKFWIWYTDNGVKTNYNLQNNATNILAWGIADTNFINYYDGSTYGLDEAVNQIGVQIPSYSVDLINRILKNESYLATGFINTFEIERISS